MVMTNEDRADRAMSAMLQYVSEEPERTELMQLRNDLELQKEVTDEAARDLIGDILHHCWRLGIDTAIVIERAEATFYEEVAEEEAGEDDE